MAVGNIPMWPLAAHQSNRPLVINNWRSCKNLCDRLRPLYCLPQIQMKSPKCVICPSSPAGKIDLTVDNGKRRFKRHRQRKRLCPIAQRLRLTHALKVSVAEKGSVSDATSSPIALNVAVMAMMIGKQQPSLYNMISHVNERQHQYS